VRLQCLETVYDLPLDYRSRGFAERSPYEGTEIPERLQKYWSFFERPLRPD
jgi:hypothetical protein